MAKASSLRRMVLTPIAAAAVSSSRMATQARPIRLSLSRTKTRMTTASSDQQQEVVVGEAAESDAEELVGLAEVAAEQVQVRDAGDAVGTVGEVRSGVPSRLFMAMRKISPKPSVTIAR